MWRWRISTSSSRSPRSPGANTDHHLDHLAGDAVRIERGKRLALRADVSRLPCATSCRSRPHPRLPARAPDEFAQIRDLQFARGTPRARLARPAGALTLQAVMASSSSRSTRTSTPTMRADLGHGVSLQSDPGHPCGALSRARPRPAHRRQARPDSAMLIDATNEGAVPPWRCQTALYGKRQGAVGAGRPAGPRARDAVVGYSLGDWTEEWITTPRTPPAASG